MDKIEIIKKASLMVVGLGVGSVVSNVANDAAPENSKWSTRAVTWIGVAALSYVIADKVQDYFEPKINMVIDEVNKIIVEVKERSK